MKTILNPYLYAIISLMLMILTIIGLGSILAMVGSSHLANFIFLILFNRILLSIQVLREKFITIITKLSIAINLSFILLLILILINYFANLKNSFGVAYIIFISTEIIFEIYLIKKQIRTTT